MRKGIIITGLCLLCLVLLGNQASALPLRIEDTYIGGDDHEYGDVISADGEENLFDVDWMDVDIAGDIMTVNVHTDFGIGKTYGLDYGDLFLSINGWNPNGDAPYMNDDASTGENWEYAFDVSSGRLYDIRSTEGQAAILNSEDVLPAGGTFRDGQEVLLDTTNLDAYIVSQGGSAGRNGEYYSMQFDISGMNMDFDNFTLGTHWTMTCANDVIEGEFDPDVSAVPEPSTLLLFGSGLLGAWAWGRKRRK